MQIHQLHASLLLCFHHFFPLLSFYFPFASSLAKFCTKDGRKRCGNEGWGVEDLAKKESVFSTEVL